MRNSDLTIVIALKIIFLVCFLLADSQLRSLSSDTSFLWSFQSHSSCLSSWEQPSAQMSRTKPTSGKTPPTTTKPRQPGAPARLSLCGGHCPRHVCSQGRQNGVILGFKDHIFCNLDLMYITKDFTRTLTFRLWAASDSLKKKIN